MMNRSRRLPLLLSLLSVSLLLSACTPAQPAAPQSPTAQAQQKETAMPKVEYKKMTPQEAKARIDSGDSVIILDVREQSEYAAGHIPDAVLLPLAQIEQNAASLLADKDAEILLYCRSGNRSRQAALRLIDMGYTNVHDFGGIISWPFETVVPTP